MQHLKFNNNRVLYKKVGFKNVNILLNQVKAGAAGDLPQLSILP